MRLLPLVALVWLLALGAQARSYELACYGADLPLEGSGIKTLRILIPPMDLTEESTAVYAKAQYWGLPDIVLSGAAGCRNGQGSTPTCFTECTTAGATFRQLDDETVLAIFDQFLFGAEILSEALDVSHPEAQYSGPLVLTRRDDKVCTIPGSPGGLRASLEPGDVSRYVEQAKLALSTMGYPVTSIDRVFDLDTRESLRAFQTSIGFPATGELDADTLQMLKVHGSNLSC